MTASGTTTAFILTTLTYSCSNYLAWLSFTNAHLHFFTSTSPFPLVVLRSTFSANTTSEPFPVVKPSRPVSQWHRQRLLDSCSRLIETESSTALPDSIVFACRGRSQLPGDCVLISALPVVMVRFMLCYCEPRKSCYTLAGVEIARIRSRSTIIVNSEGGDKRGHD